MTVYLSEIAFVDARRKGTSAATTTWNEDGSKTIPDVAGFFPNNPSISRTDAASRFLLAAGSLLPMIPPDLMDDVAIVIGTRNGSLDADRRFAESLLQRPQPRIYARTLPSIPPAELAIFLGTRGPILTLAGTGSIGLSALAAACDFLALGRAKMAIAGMYEYAPLDGIEPLAIVALVSSAPVMTKTNPIEVINFSGISDASEDLTDLYQALLNNQAIDVTGASEGNSIRVSKGQNNSNSAMPRLHVTTEKEGPQ